MDLRPVKSHPIQFNLPNRLVYETHNYIEFQIATLFSNNFFSWRWVANMSTYVLVVLVVLDLVVLYMWLRIGRPWPRKSTLLALISGWAAIFFAVVAGVCAFGYHFYLQYCSYVAQYYFLPNMIICAIASFALLLLGFWAAKFGLRVVATSDDCAILPEVCECAASDDLGSSSEEDLPRPIIHFLCGQPCPLEEAGNVKCRVYQAVQAGGVIKEQEAKLWRVPGFACEPGYHSLWVAQEYCIGTKRKLPRLSQAEAPVWDSGALVRIAVDDLAGRYFEDLVLRCAPTSSIVQSLVLAAMQGYRGLYTPVHLRRRIMCSTVSLSDQTRSLYVFHLDRSWPVSMDQRPLMMEKTCCRFVLDTKWGFALAEGFSYTAPVWMGEFGQMEGYFTKSGVFHEWDHPRWEDEHGARGLVDSASCLDSMGLGCLALILPCHLRSTRRLRSRNPWRTPRGAAGSAASALRRQVPNVLTAMRVLLVVPIVALFCWGDRRLCTVLFALSSLTDFLDGYLARRWEVTSPFGKFLDPVADKLLACSVLVLLPTASGSAFAPGLLAVPAVLIILREIFVSALREWTAMAGHSTSTQELVQAQTFGIFPLSPGLGLVEVVSESRTLRELSEGVPFNERQWRVVRALNQEREEGVPELKPLLPEVHEYVSSLSLSSFDHQVERAADWTLQRAAKNTLREALRYVTAEQEVEENTWYGFLDPFGLLTTETTPPRTPATPVTPLTPTALPAPALSPPTARAERMERIPESSTRRLCRALRKLRSREEGLQLVQQQLNARPSGAETCGLIDAFARQGWFYRPLVDLASQQLSTGTSASPPHLAVTLRALATLHPPSLARWRGPLNAPPVGRRHGWFAAVVLLRSLLLAEVVMDGLLGKVPELQVVAFRDLLQELVQSWPGVAQPVSGISEALELHVSAAFQRLGRTVDGLHRPSGARSGHRRLPLSLPELKLVLFCLDQRSFIYDLQDGRSWLKPLTLLHQQQLERCETAGWRVEVILDSEWPEQHLEQHGLSSE
eukprot:g602.t1